MKRLCFVALVFALLAFPSNVRADVAPPYYPPGSNPQPGVESTQVRMMAETVLIDVQRVVDPDYATVAHVTADFTMRNLGTTEENMAARFPIGNDNEWTGYSEIDNLLIKVNGKQVQYRQTSHPERIAPTDDMAQWAEFDITFPVGPDVPIHIEYDLTGTGYYPATAFYYILETGAGWKDTIGSAEIILRLPYEANPQNVIMDLEIGWATTTPGGVFEGNEVHWHFEDFEPGQDQPVQNMEFALVDPFAWQTVLSAQANAAKNPDDGEAWGMPAKAYKLAFLAVKGYREDAGGQELYKLSVEAYEKCLALKPQDAQWHAGFADLLSHRAMWDAMDGDKTPEALRALNEIRTALELAPDDPTVQDIARSMTNLLYGGITENGEDFDFPWLTPIPSMPAIAPVAEATATPPAAPTKTTAPQAGAVSTRAAPASDARRSSPLCGSAAFLPLIAVLRFAWKRR